MSSDQYPDYFMTQSCLHIVINYLWPPKTDQNMPLFVPFPLMYHWPVPNSAKFRENIEIPRLGSKFHDPGKTVVPTS